MTKQTSSPGRTTNPFARNSLGGLDAKTAAEVVTASGDVAMLIDRGGVIRDIAVINGALDGQEPSAWLDRRWVDTVTVESRPKIEEMLRDAASDGGARWREVNYPIAGGAEISMRCIAVHAGDDGRVIAIGRDQRLIAELQQTLVEAQHAVQREHQRARDAESRYRLLFQLATEAVLVVEASSRRVVEANPAAERYVGAADMPLPGTVFASVFDNETRESAANLLAMAQTGARLTAQQQLMVAGRAFTAAASFFRHDRASYFLVRLTPLDAAPARAEDAAGRLAKIVNRMPDAFVVADESMKIVVANDAFLEMARFATQEQAIGQSLDDFLGRPDTDRNILVSTLRQYGVLKSFATVLRNRLGEREDVDVSAVYVNEGGGAHFGFTIRAAARGQTARAQIERELPRSVEQLSQLVGRVTLKELVRETTDIVERLCIEAALELTDNNRASAAEILGLSRQSLYSKLHRHGLAEFGHEQTDA